MSMLNTQSRYSVIFTRMSMPSTSTLLVKDLEVVVIRKKIKNINLAVYPPDGRVRISAPLQASDSFIRSAVSARISWIKQKQALLQGKTSLPDPQLVSGERHAFFGQLLELKVVERGGRNDTFIQDENTLVLQVQPCTSVEKKTQVLNEWYRQELKMRIPDLLEQWQPIIGVEASEWRIKRMKTRWGTCNITQKRIWLNLELAKMSPECLEYVLVHELVHLLESSHNKRFWNFMDTFLPSWRTTRSLLKQQSLGSPTTESGATWLIGGYTTSITPQKYLNTFMATLNSYDFDKLEIFLVGWFTKHTAIEGRKFATYLNGLEK